MPETNKEILRSIKESQDLASKRHFDFSAKVSAFMNVQADVNNEQKLINNKLVGYLENNDKTGSKGGINRLNDIEKKQLQTDVKIKIVIGVFTALLFVVNFYEKIASLFTKH